MGKEGDSSATESFWVEQEQLQAWTARELPGEFWQGVPIDTGPGPGNWDAHLLGIDGRVVFTPQKGGEPNRFHRLMHRLLLGIVWKRRG